MNHLLPTVPKGINFSTTKIAPLPVKTPAYISISLFKITNLSRSRKQECVKHQLSLVQAALSTACG